MSALYPQCIYDHAFSLDNKRLSQNTVKTQTMVVVHSVKPGLKPDVPSKRHKQRDTKNTFSVSVTSLPPTHGGEFESESELEASGTRIAMEQTKEDENHNHEILEHSKFITFEETYNEDDIERTSEVDEDISTLADYEHLHPVTKSIFQQLATTDTATSENTERLRVNPPQLYMPNAIRSSRLRRMNYSPWGYDSPAHGDIINISPGKQGAFIFVICTKTFNLKGNTFLQFL